MFNKPNEGVKAVANAVELKEDLCMQVESEKKEVKENNISENNLKKGPGNNSENSLAESSKPDTLNNATNSIKNVPTKSGMWLATADEKGNIYYYHKKTLLVYLNDFKKILEINYSRNCIKSLFF